MKWVAVYDVLAAVPYFNRHEQFSGILHKHEQEFLDPNCPEKWIKYGFTADKRTSCVNPAAFRKVIEEWL